MWETFKIHINLKDLHDCAGLFGTSGPECWPGYRSPQQLSCQPAEVLRIGASASLGRRSHGAPLCEKSPCCRLYSWACSRSTRPKKDFEEVLPRPDFSPRATEEEGIEPVQVHSSWYDLTIRDDLRACVVAMTEGARSILHRVWFKSTRPQSGAED